MSEPAYLCHLPSPEPSDACVFPVNLAAVFVSRLCHETQTEKHHRADFCPGLPTPALYTVSESVSAGPTGAQAVGGWDPAPCLPSPGCPTRPRRL